MKIAITTYYSPVSSYKEKWEEQMRTWVPQAKKLNIPIYSLVANPNVKGEEKDYLQIGDFIHFDGKMRFDNGKYDITLSHATNSVLQWAKDQNLDYLLMVDNDVFVEPLRLLRLLQKYQHIPSIIYAGHCIPYLGWDFTKYPCLHVSSPPNKTYYASGGAGIILSKEGIKIASSNFLKELEECPEDKKSYNDYVLGKVFKNQNVPLFQDGRIFIEFPGKPIIINGSNLSIPYIGDPKSPLVCQHEANGHMDEIAIKLGYSN
jgi:hypothetical protein